MNGVIIIPARYDSKRLPGKPLVPIAGKSLLHRVWSLAKRVSGVDEVIVATDDARIADHAREFGGRVVMTSRECRNGTERAREAVKRLDAPPEFVVNFQGDAVLTPPWVIQAIVDEIRADPSVRIATPAVRLTLDAYRLLDESKRGGEVGGTTVVFDVNRNALYFSKSLIPYVRTVIGSLPVYRHIGLYGYRYSTLEHYLSLPMGPLEQAEELEQLRALEHGIPVRVVTVDYRGRTHWGVDSEADVRRVEEIIGREGEL